MESQIILTCDDLEKNSGTNVAAIGVFVMSLLAFLFWIHKHGFCCQWLHQIICSMQGDFRVV